MERLSSDLQGLVDAERAEVEPSVDALGRTKNALLERVAAAGAASAVVATSTKAAAGAASSVSAALALKVGLSVVVLGGAAAFAVSRFTGHAALAPRTAQTAPRESQAVLPRPEASEVVQPIAPPIAKEPDVPRTARAPSSVAPEKAAPPLAEEVRLLKDAQQALKAGNAGAALAALSEHERRFPRGQLSLERAAVRIQALCAAGRVEEAKRAGAAFLSRHAGSALADRVRASCVGTGTSEP